MEIWNNQLYNSRYFSIFKKANIIIMKKRVQVRVVTTRKKTDTRKITVHIWISTGGTRKIKVPM